MNILLNSLPDSVEIDGEMFPIYTDFRHWIQFQIRMNKLSTDSSMTEMEKGLELLSVYKDDLPKRFEKAISALIWFLTGGQAEVESSDEKQNTTNNKPARAYDFEQDAEMIYAAFYQAYGIDLSAQEHMHWWKFKSLFNALPKETMFSYIVSIRQTDTSQMSKDAKKRIDSQKRALRIKGDVPVFQTLEQRDAIWKENYAKRAEKAGLKKMGEVPKV